MVIHERNCVIKVTPGAAVMTLEFEHEARLAAPVVARRETLYRLVGGVLAQLVDRAAPGPPEPERKNAKKNAMTVSFGPREIPRQSGILTDMKS